MAADRSHPLLIVLLALAVYCPWFLYVAYIELKDKIGLSRVPEPRVKVKADFGWIVVDNKRVARVDTLSRVPGMKYHYKRVERAYEYEEYVYVSDELNNIIELYVRGDGYSDMELDEFIMKTLFNTLQEK